MLKRLLSFLILGSSFVAAQTVEAFLQPPFLGDYMVSNVFDHEYPFPFKDEGRVQLAWWGQKISMGYAGHAGYDWRMPEGTLLVAAAEGTVVVAGERTGFCPNPRINRDTTGKSVILRHEVNGAVFHTGYFHLSNILVKEGDLVKAQHAIGYSGNTGCSTTPHLHFSVRIQQADGSFIEIDPYGWQADGADPWEVHAEGSASKNLWLRAPQLFKESNRLDLIENAEVLITKVRYLHIDSQTGENKQFIELKLNKEEAPYGHFLGQYQLINNQGARYELPDDLYIYADSVVRIHSGQGQNSETEIYLGAIEPIWNESGDCVRLKRKGVSWILRFGYGVEGCQS